MEVNEVPTVLEGQTTIEDLLDDSTVRVPTLPLAGLPVPGGGWSLSAFLQPSQSAQWPPAPSDPAI